jgi:hypothetical protein
MEVLVVIYSPAGDRCPAQDDGVVREKAHGFPLPHRGGGEVAVIRKAALLDREQGHRDEQTRCSAPDGTGRESVEEALDAANVVEMGMRGDDRLRQLAVPTKLGVDGVGAAVDQKARALSRLERRGGSPEYEGMGTPRANKPQPEIRHKDVSNRICGRSKGAVESDRRSAGES